MLHLRPIQLQHASPIINDAYKDIQQVFGIETIPLVFQYIANFELYFLFLWDKMKKNIHAPDFKTSMQSVQSFALQAIEISYTPSSVTRDFMVLIHPLEKQRILETVILLERTNIILMLLLIDLRESLKSIFIGTQRLTQFASELGKENFAESLQKDMFAPDPSHGKEMSEVTRMLAPLFGTNDIVISHYPDFFAHIAAEMEKVKNSEVYLKSRVSLEHIALQCITTFVQPLGISYQEFLKLTNGKPYINELLFLLTDSFPSQFPHLVFTSAMMRFLLKNHTAMSV